MITKISKQKMGIHLLRLGLAGVFLWFGFSQLFNSLVWVNTVPEWAVNFFHLPPAMIVMGNGIFEIILGSLLAMGFFVRVIAIIFAIHLIPIAFSFGLTATGVRDFGLIIACLSLALMSFKEENCA